jgi:hypothetical protein
VVCVPAEWTREEALEFAGDCGTTKGWTIHEATEEERAKGGLTAAPCSKWPENVHYLLDA